jgi:hypothetical protein
MMGKVLQLLWVVRLGAFAILALMIPRIGEDALNPPQSWAQDREIGQSIDGYWHSAASAGCFENENVYQYDGDQQLTSLDGITWVAATNVETRIENGHVYIDELLLFDPERPRMPARFVYRDEGSKLVLSEAIIDGETVIASGAEAGPASTWKLCDSDNFWSRIHLLWRDPFRANQTMFVDIDEA